MINEIANKIKEQGGRAFYTGGYVRDLFINKSLGDIDIKDIEAEDIDIEVFHMEEAELLSVLAEFGIPKVVGKIYPVIKIAGFPRLDFTIATYNDYDKAVLRRDFTINALMIDILTGEILDFVGGREDIAKGVIRHTREDIFIKDSLRAYRAVVLAARLDFTIHPETISLIENTDLSNLPPERIYEELKKLLILAPKPSIGLRYLEQTNILKKVHPELYNLIGCKQAEKHHPEGDVWTHTLLVVDKAAKLKDKSENPTSLMWAALLHDIGKPATTKMKVDKIVSYGHDRVGEEIARKFLHNLKASNILIKEVTTLVREHMHPVLLYKQKEEVTDKAIRKLVNRVNLRELLLLSEADYLGREIERDYTLIRNWFLDKVEELGLDPSQKIKPLFTGQDLIDLGVKPDQNFKKLLDYAFDLQLEGKDKDEIMKMLKMRI